MNHYETVFILNPVLSDEQIKETVKKFEGLLTGKGAKFVNKEDWGLKKLAYPIQNKKSGFYHLFEFTAPGDAIAPLEVEFRRDERLLKPTCKTRESIHLRAFIRPAGQIAPKHRTIPSRQGATQEDNSKKKSQIDEKIK